MSIAIKILKKSAKKFWYWLRKIDKVTHSLFEISNWNKSFFANPYIKMMYPINNYFSSNMVADKAFCYQILAKYWFKIPVTKHFFFDYSKIWKINKYNKLNYIEKYIKSLSYPVFIKPNNASLWKWAEVIYNKKELKMHLNYVKSITNICIVQEYIKAPEYRIFVVNWEIQFTYKRSAASIIWNWKSTIKKILKKTWNNTFIKSKYFLNELYEKKYTLDTILTKNENILLQSKTNISAGWDISEFNLKVWKKLEKWTKELISKFDIWVCWIDVFAPSGINKPKDFIIIELNSNPSLKGIYELWYKKTVYNVWKNIFNFYFNRTNIINKNRKYRWISKTVLYTKGNKNCIKKNKNYI